MHGASSVLHDTADEEKVSTTPSKKDDDDDDWLSKILDFHWLAFSPRFRDWWRTGDFVRDSQSESESESGVTN